MIDNQLYMALFEALGLNIQILVAQLINFSILLFVLWKFGYGPMAKFLEERKDKIEKGIEDAESAGKKLKEIEEKEKEVLKTAKKEAAIILEKAREQSEENKKKAVEKAKAEIGQIINKEKETIALEKARTLKELRGEMAELIMQATEKIILEKMDGKKDMELINKTLKSIK